MIANRFKYNFNLTAESFRKLCGNEFKKENIGVSINISLAFFKKYRLRLAVYRPFGCILTVEKPENWNKNINIGCLCLYSKESLLRDQYKCQEEWTNGNERR